MTNVRPLVMCDQARRHLLEAHTNDANPVGIEQHIERCPSCWDFARELSSVDAAIKRAHLSELPPDRAWERVLHSLDAEDARAAARISLDVPAKRAVTTVFARWLYPSVPFWRKAAAGLVALAVIAAAAIVIDPIAMRNGHQVEALIREPINDLITYRVSHRPLDLESNDPRRISEWWADKLDFQAPSPIAEIDGYRLIGGRLCYFLNRRLSALMYQKDAHLVSLYVMSSEQLALPRDDDSRIDGWKASVHEHKGYTSVIWEEGSLAFALVGDLPRNDLLHAANDLRRSWGRSSETRVRANASPVALIMRPSLLRPQAVFTDPTLPVHRFYRGEPT